MNHQQARTDGYPIQISNETLIQQGVVHGFLCQEDEIFWDSIETCDSIGEEVEEIKLSEKFYEEFPVASKGIWKSIKRFLCLESDDTIVTRANFINLTKYFGSVKPFNRSCILASQVASLVQDSRHDIGDGTRNKISWFVGFMEVEEVRRRLKSCKPGTFLIRFNSQEPGEFIVNIKGERDEVVQRIIKGNPFADCDDPGDYDAAFQIDPDHESQPTLVEFVNERVLYKYIGGIKCEYIYPDSPLNVVFTGYK